MKIILIGNYSPDGQQSMERFARLLEKGFRKNGHRTDIWKPPVCFGRMGGGTDSGLGKWLGYIDKWLVFPLVLRWKALFHGDSFFHVCDHSNSPYLAHLPAARSSITCHDVLAIRGALGFEDSFCPASRFGEILQKWILANLSKARKLAAVSELTLGQLQDLCPGKPDWRVIHNSLNEEFWVMEEGKSLALLEQYGISGATEFLLHVGSDLPRKNRKMLLEMAVVLGDGWTGKICFAGQEMDTELRGMVEKLGLSGRVIEVVGPDHETLVALYSRCAAFVFPSYSEGFGWPLIEAQACGAPVIASDVEPMPEISGGTAIHVSPDHSEGFAGAFSSLLQQDVRRKVAEEGLRNTRRFSREKMTGKYLEMISGEGRDQ